MRWDAMGRDRHTCTIRPDEIRQNYTTQKQIRSAEIHLFNVCQIRKTNNISGTQYKPILIYMRSVDITKGRRNMNEMCRE